MQTLDLTQAAAMLKMNSQVLRRKAKEGTIPGKKAGKCWIFVDEHLADWISGRYAAPARTIQVIDGGKHTTGATNPCQSINVKKTVSGGWNTAQKAESEYRNLLAPKTNKKPKSCTTKKRPKAGE